MSKDMKSWFDKLPTWTKVTILCSLPLAYLVLYLITLLGYSITIGPVVLIPPKATDTVTQQIKTTDTIKTIDTVYLPGTGTANEKRLSRQDINNFVPYVKRLLVDSSLNDLVFIETLHNTNSDYIATQLIQALRSNNIKIGFGQSLEDPNNLFNGIKFKIERKYLVICVGLFE